ncbi:MAG TPA: DUF4870 domain-containing protein [Gemmataceae bacterium]|nr:DUF4870 domain-containing protein [Gemmataceae bacterium]
MARRDDDDDDRDRDDEDNGKSKKKSSGGKVSADDKLWGMLAHIAGLLGFGLIGPLVIMLIYKDKSKYVTAHAKEALNFDITMVLICMTCIGVLFAAPVSLIYHIIAAMAANRGEEFKYPFTLRLIK